MPDLGQAYVQIVPSAEGISGSISNVLNPESKSAGNEAGTLIGEGCISATTAAIAAGAAAVTAAVGATLKLAADTAEYGDTIDKQSQKIGISNAAYQEWSFILQHCGTDIGTMQRGMKSLNSAAESNSEAFEKLGLSMDDVQSMTQEELFSKVISGLQQMDSGMERNQLANDLLGRSYQELQPLLNTTAEDTEKMRQSFSDLGGMMSDEAVSAGASYEDSLLDLQTAFDGIKRSLVSELVPALSTGMEWFAKFISQSDEMSLLKDIISSIASGMSSVLMPAMTVLGEAFNSLQEAFKPVAESLGEVFANFHQANGEFSLGQVLATALVVPISALASAFKVVATVIGAVVAIFKALKAGFDAVRTGFNTLRNAINTGVNTIHTRFSTLRKTLTDPFKKAWEKAKGVVDKIKGLFPIDIGRILKGIKTPKFSINTSTKDLGKLGSFSYPTGISVKWNAEGGIFDRASIIGYGVGEAGQEAIIPLDSFWNHLDSALANSNSDGGVVNLVLNLDGATIAKSTIKYINGQTIRYNQSPLMV